MRDELLKLAQEIDLRFVSGNHVPVSRASITVEEWKSIRESLANATQGPIDAILMSDCVEGTHPQYGQGLFCTRDAVRSVYLATPKEEVK